MLPSTIIKWILKVKRLEITNWWHWFSTQVLLKQKGVQQDDIDQIIEANDAEMVMEIWHFFSFIQLF